MVSHKQCNYALARNLAGFAKHMTEQSPTWEWRQPTMSMCWYPTMDISTTLQTALRESKLDVQPSSISWWWSRGRGNCVASGRAHNVRPWSSSIAARDYYFECLSWLPLNPVGHVVHPVNRPSHLVCSLGASLFHGSGYAAVLVWMPVVSGIVIFLKYGVYFSHYFPSIRIYFH